MKDLLNRINIFKPNQYEAQELSGIFIKDDTTAVQCLDWFLEHGVQEVIISLAESGILLGTREEKIHFTHRQIQLENATGGGDSFLGAYLKERTNGSSPKEAARFGISAAVTTIEQDAVRRRSLNAEEVRRAIENMNIEERVL